MGKNYSVGLDIGTNSVGWAVISDDLKLIRRRMKINGDTDTQYVKKNFWGAAIFDAGQTAEERRLKRTSRRRNERRHQRLSYLREMFYEEITKIDIHFFDRLDESFFVVEDKKYSEYPIFGKVEEEINYHKTYPTIYHLRKELADSSSKADIRLIYLALAHIIKFRGHFLIEGDLNSENTSISNSFSNFLLTYNELFNKEEISLEVDSSKVESILKEKKSRTRRFESIIEISEGEKKNGMFAQFIKLIVGNQGNFKTVFKLSEEAKLDFSKETFEEDLEELMNVLDETYLELFIAAKNVYDAVELTGIISDSQESGNAKLSSKMIEFYQEHNKDLKKFKKYIRKTLPESYNEIFNDSSKNGYAGYIDGKASQVEFYDYIKKKIKKIEDSEYFQRKIDEESFLRKQRSFYNGVIPHQVHLGELKAIINRQKKFYPFLEPLVDRIEKLFKFRIPYYIGPLAKGNSEFAWLIRKKEGKINPWNFDEIVDSDASAIKFIEKMTNNDTYLPDYKVLPKRSLVYQKYTIFNELTKVSYTDDRSYRQNFSSVEKLDIFENLFKKTNKVSKKILVEFLRNNYHIESAKIHGIEENFNASYSTYLDLIKIDGMQKILDNPEYEEDLEQIIKILTIFEDRKMKKKQLQKYSEILNEKQINQLSRKKYNGWGRLSAKLLNGIRDEQTNKTILDYLINDDGIKTNINRNFMQLINDDKLSFKSKIHEAQTLKETATMLDVVRNLPGSPAIKKGILQSLKIVNEIVEIIGELPDSITVEMARENQTTEQGRRSSRSRYTKLEKAINDLGSNILKKSPTDNEQLKKDRLYLYYLQNGKDMYTGESLDINKLSFYDIDHIIPQSFTTDNSISNRVLVKSTLNRGNKSDNVPSIEIVNKMDNFWKSLLKSGLIDERKYNNLTKSSRGGLTEADKAKFLNRQLVETRQITKYVANILDSHFNNERDEKGKVIKNVRIITLKSSLTTQFRKEFDLFKVRGINDVHHAHDAYLNAVISNKLLKVYPHLEPHFVYGDFPYFDLVKENRATARKQKITNIMKFFSNKELIVSQEGEVIWDSQRDIARIKRTLESKQVNIVKKTETKTGAFYGENILSRRDSDKLLPIKTGLNPRIYGGYSGSDSAYNVVIQSEFGKNKKLEMNLHSITLLEQKEFERDERVFLEGKGYVNPFVIMKIPKYTLYEFNDGSRRMTSGATENHKANQMLLSNNLVELLYHAERYDEINTPYSTRFVKDNLDKFEELLNEILSFAEKYLNYSEEKRTVLKQLYADNKNQNIESVAKSFVELLKLTTTGAPVDFQFFDKKIIRHRYRNTKEILGTVVIHQSITGLYETKVRLELK